MATHKWTDVKKAHVKKGKISQAKADKIEQEVAAELEAFNLRQLRDTAGLTQAQMAAKLDVVQSRLSQLEAKGQDHRLSTLRRYVEALGGELKVEARFGRKTVELAV